MVLFGVASHACRSLTVPLIVSLPETQLISALLIFCRIADTDFSGVAALGVLLIVAVTALTFSSGRFVEEAFSDRQRS